MKNFLLLLTTGTLICCAAGNSDNSNPQLSGKMNQAARALQELLPYLYSRDKFNDKKNKKTIEKQMIQFKSSLHNIEPELAKTALGDDPYVLQSLKSLNELSDRSIQTFQKGDLRTSRILLKATTNTCFKCHTRQTMGVQSIQWDNFDIEKIETDPLEKAHLLVAMRQFEEAKLYLTNFITDREQEDNFDPDYETALHYYLMISLRGQQTYESALNFIRAKILITKSPTEIHYTLKHWEKDLKHWKKHAGKLKPNLSHARGVLKRNGKRYSQRNLINNLVASSLLHSYLASNPTQVDKARAYSTLGYIYDELIVEGFWDLPEMYYEMCIRYAPKTKIAQTCYRQIRNNITLGYSGSRGTLIPSQEYERLDELRKLSGL